MSARGLGAFAAAHSAADPLPVRLGKVERSFCVPMGEGSPGGPRLDAGLRVRSWPLGAVPLAATPAPEPQTVEALALTLAPGSWGPVAAAAGCGELMGGLVREASSADAEVPQSLWQQAIRVADFAYYQRSIYQQTRWWSATYVPVPVHLGTEPALAFVPPTMTLGEVVPTALVPGLSLAQAAEQLGPGNDQAAAYRSCVLGGVHGLDVRDLLDPTAPGGTLQWSEVEQERREAVARWFGDDEAAYVRTFGQLQDNLRRSGLAAATGPPE